MAASAVECTTATRRTPPPRRAGSLPTRPWPTTTSYRLSPPTEIRVGSSAEIVGDSPRDAFIVASRRARARRPRPLPRCVCWCRSHSRRPPRRRVAGLRSWATRRVTRSSWLRGEREHVVRDLFRGASVGVDHTHGDLLVVGSPFLHGAAQPGPP